MFVEKGNTVTIINNSQAPNSVIYELLLMLFRVIGKRIFDMILTKIESWED